MAARNSNPKMKKLLLNNGSKLPPGFIKEAIQNNSIDNLKILVDLTTDLNSLHYGQTFLHLCCIPAEGAPPGEPFDTRRCELIRFFIEKGANVNARNGYGDKPLGLALRHKYFAVVKFLVLNYDVDINFIDGKGRPLFHHLISNYKFHVEDENLLARFLERGFNINSQDNDGNSILHHACIYQEADVIEFLIRNGANVNLKNSSHYLPLHLTLPGVITKRDDWNFTIDRQVPSILQVIQVLRRSNADVNAVDDQRRTILHLACKYDNPDVIKGLLENQADPNAADVDGVTPLMEAINRLPVIKLLLDFNADVDAVDNKNKTALHHACCKRNVEVVQLLLESGANPNVLDMDKYTPMMRAQRSLVIIKCLVDHNADVNAKGDANQTILHVACRRGNIEGVKFLLETGADPNVIDFFGCTPIMRVVGHLLMSSKVKLVKCLLDFNADVYAQNNDGETLLHFASRHGHVDVIRFVLHRHLDLIYIDDKLGRNALHSAGFDFATSETLLSYGADAQKMDKSGLPAARWTVGALNRYIIKMKCLGRILKINRELFNGLIYDDGGQSNESIRSDVNDFKAKCNAEIEAMKITEVGDSNVTLYGLLMNGYHGYHDVVNIFGYEELITILEEDSYREQFPLYIDMVFAQVVESGMRRKLLETAEMLVLIGIFKNLPHECVCKILGYLNGREIEPLFNALRFEDIEKN